MLDMVVKRSFGAYTHDEVYYMQAKFVMMLSLMYFEQDMLQQRQRSIRESLKEKFKHK